MSERPVVFIHTNAQQMLGAHLTSYALKSRCKHGDTFDVRMTKLEETPHLLQFENRVYTWVDENAPVVWYKDDPQAFVYLRRCVPDLMNFTGRALSVDPDVFCVSDVCDLLNRDMQGKAILCRKKVTVYEGKSYEDFSSAVMLLDCSKLKHWDWRHELDEIFSGRAKMAYYFSLKNEDPNTIGSFENGWNDLDTLDQDTKMIHFTERLTQPWKTGLPFIPELKVHVRGNLVTRPLRRMKRWLFSKDTPLPKKYIENPRPEQVHYFITLLREAIDAGAVTKQFLREEIAKGHLRTDLLEAAGLVV